MRKVLPSVVIALLFMGVTSPAQADGYEYNNAYFMQSGDVKSSGISGVTCARFEYFSGGKNKTIFKPGKWVGKAGTANRPQAFISFDQHAKNLLAMSKDKQFKKSKRDAYAAQSKAEAKKATQYAVKCKTINYLKFADEIKTTSSIFLQNTAELNNFAPRYATTTRKSNIYVVNGSGTPVQAIVNGYPQARLARVSPDGSLYILFANFVSLTDATLDVGDPSSTTCMLIRIPLNSSTPSCVETSMVYVQPDLQFASDGTLTYLAESQNNGIYIRMRKPDGTVISLNNSTALYQFQSFRLLANKNVIASGYNESNNSSFIRYYYLDGSTWKTSVLNAQSGAGFIQNFGTGTYIGMDNKVLSFNSETRSLNADNPYLGFYDQGVTVPNGTINSAEICGFESPATPLCSQPGNAYSFVTLANGSTYAIAGDNGWTGNEVARYAPTPSRVTLPSGISVPKLMIGGGINLIIYGTNSSGMPVLYQYKPTTDVSTVIRPASAQFEVFHMVYKASTNEVLFEGLKPDNSYVVVTRNLDTGAEVELAAGTMGLTDLDVR